MQIYLIRHTAVEVPTGLCYGHQEVELKADYPQEFDRLKKKLPKDFDRIISSPSRRCLRLAESFQSSIEIDKRLKELNFGGWEGKLWDEIPKAEMTAWMENYVKVAPPHGESMLAMFLRVSEVLDEFRRQKHERIAIVTHAGVIRCMLCYLLQIPLKNVFKVKVEYGQVFEIYLDKESPLDQIGFV